MITIKRSEIDEVRVKVKTLQDEQDELFERFCSTYSIEEGELKDCIFDMIYNDFGLDLPDHPLIKDNLNIED